MASNMISQTKTPILIKGGKKRSDNIKKNIKKKAKIRSQSIKIEKIRKNYENME